jgi:hypothetical protein
MAPATSASVFTICRAPWPELDGVRTVFAIMTSGFEVLDQLVANDVIVKVTVAPDEASLPLRPPAAEAAAPR